jgi:uncharacterized protein YnzC (UPF0291/DUF896 family)
MFYQKTEEDVPEEVEIIDILDEGGQDVADVF